MCKIPGFQDLPEPISRIQGKKKKKKKKKKKIKDLFQGQNQSSRVFPGFQDFRDRWPPCIKSNIQKSQILFVN